MVKTLSSVNDKILVALDVDTLDEALSLVETLQPYVGGFKVGLELCTHVGTRQVIDAISHAGGNVFVDLKFKDIPNTVAGAVKAVARDGVLMFNVHCDGGSAMLRAAVTTAHTMGVHAPLVIGVTVLTSIDEQILNEELHVPGSIRAQVVRLAQLAQSAGLDGVVCSPHEVAAIKEACGPQFLTVVPGVRPAWSAAGDQRRIMSPAAAMRAGADYLVIGRPITHPPATIGTPVDAVRRIVEEVMA